jgi:hypothetical protein
MKKCLLSGLLALLAGSLFAADSSPKDDVTNAAKKLGDSANYTWHTTVVVPDDAQFKPGPTDGQTEKGGFTDVKLSFGDNTTEFVKKGEDAAVTDPDGNWQSLTNLENNSEGPGRFLVGMVRNFKAPDAQAVQLVAGAKELKKDGDVYSSDLTEDGAKAMMTFGRRRAGGPTITNPSGSVKFWLTDGALTKYEFKVKGTMSFNGNDIDVDRDTTVEIKDVGATKIAVPDDAKKKLSS